MRGSPPSRWRDEAIWCDSCGVWLRDPEAWDIHKKQKKHTRATGEVAPKKLPGAKEEAKELAKALLKRVYNLCLIRWSKKEQRRLNARAKS